MSALATVMLILWLPTCLLMVWCLPPLKAIVYGYLAAMTLLPTGTLPLDVCPDIDKWQMTGVGLTLGLLLFQPQRLSRLRLILPDYCLLTFVVCTGVTSVVNGLGPYDAVSSAFRMFLRYAAPYFLIRTAYRDERDVLWLCQAIIVAAALYAILAVWEFRMSPQMHRSLYGYSFQGWREHYRHGFYRPLLFFEHGIPLAFFFASTSVLAIWLWSRNALKAVRSLLLPRGALVILPTVGTLVSMTYGAYAAWGASVLSLLAIQRFQWRYLALVPALAAVGWSALRYTGQINVQSLIDVAYARLPTTAAESFEYRVIADDSLLARARQAQWLGWGGWGRNRIGAVDKWDQPVAIDALWVDTVGKYGLVGLGLLYAWFIGSIVRGVSRLAGLAHPGARAAATALAVMAGLDLINWQFNGFINPTVLFGIAMLVNVSQTVPLLAVSQARSAPARGDLCRARGHG